MPLTTKKQLGFDGELLVEIYLKNNNFTVIAKNYRKRYGEIDLIATKNDIIAFIEVKTRDNPKFSALTAITTAKQKKIILAAKSFILENNISNKIFRFDVAIVTLETGTTTIKYIENAFISK